jgi:hypothetical protein
VADVGAGVPLGPLGFGGANLGNVFQAMTDETTPQTSDKFDDEGQFAVPADVKIPAAEGLVRG